MSNLEISNKGIAFVSLEEGFVSKTYPDPVGVPTIGYGFTNNSTSVRKALGPVKFGMEITKEKADAVLKVVMREEYGAAANKKMKNPVQHEFDMGCSGSYNVGVRIFGWKWCKAFNQGDKPKAAKLWSTTAMTAKGKKLSGLVARRKREADMLLNGKYARIGRITHKKTTKAKAKPNIEVLEYQKKLIKLGYEPGVADGWMGKDTEKAIKAFQVKDPHLINDGKLGRATIDSIDRMLENKSTVKKVSWTGIAGIGSSVVSWFGNQSDLIMYIFIAVVLVIGLYVFIKYRRLIESKILGMMG